MKRSVKHQANALLLLYLKDCQPWQKSNIIFHYLWITYLSTEEQAIRMDSSINCEVQNITQWLFVKTYVALWEANFKCLDLPKLVYKNQLWRFQRRSPPKAKVVKDGGMSKEKDSIRIQSILGGNLSQRTWVHHYKSNLINCVFWKGYGHGILKGLITQKKAEK